MDYKLYCFPAHTLPPPLNPSSPTDVLCHPSLLPNSTPTCFLPVLFFRSGFLWKAARIGNSHSRPGAATSPKGIALLQAARGAWSGRPHKKVDASGASEGDLHPLFQVNSSLHQIVAHRKKAQKSALTLHPPQGRPNCTSAKHWTLLTCWIPSRIPLPLPLLDKGQS